MLTKESVSCEFEPPRVRGPWPVYLFPDSVKPYGELVRIHRPAGLVLCYFPSLFGTLLVGALGKCASPTAMLLVNLKLLILSFFLRNTFVTLNDIVDQDIDRQVERTRTRPLARGALSTREAVIFLISQAVLLFAGFCTLSRHCLLYSLPFLVLHTSYPWAKRFTHHPQVVLGVANSIGIYWAFPALGQKLGPEFGANTTGAAYLTLSVFIWTITFDTIYAAQDLQDDKKVGVGSTTVYWGTSTKALLRVLAVIQVITLFAITELIREQSQSSGILCLVFTCLGTSLGLGIMIEKVDLDDPVSCGWWFNRGNVLVGITMASGIACEYVRLLM